MKIIVLVFASLYPALATQDVSAAQLQNREAIISTSEEGQTSVDYDFEFDWTTASAIQGVIFQFCTTPLGTCNLPTGMDLQGASIADDSGFPDDITPTSFVEETTLPNNDCNDMGGAGDTMYCVTRPEPTSAVGTNATVDLAGITNPTISTGVFTTVFIRISLYSDEDFTTKVHDGTVAAAIVEQLQAAGRVQERLEFCVAAIDDWETGDPGDPVPDNCGVFPSTTNIDLGVIDNSSIAKSPVEVTTTNGSNDRYGVLMVNTNAAGGVVVGFFPEVAAIVSGGDTDQLRAFRVSNTDCSATASSETDQCFVNALSSGENYATTGFGNERFGLQVPCIDADPTRASTANLVANTDYDNTDGDSSHAAHCQKVDDEGGAYPGADEGDTFAWNDSGTADTLASSTSVVDDEIIKLRFGAMAAATTPTGTYVITTTYIATATF